MDIFQRMHLMQPSIRVHKVKTAETKEKSLQTFCKLNP